MEFEIFNENNSIIKVLGVGGGGCNAINHMFSSGIAGVNFAVCNTDYQDLQKSPVPTKIQLGKELLEGLGAGADPEEGRRAALEAEEEIRMYLSNNTKMVFVTAGMGGGTGTGGAPVIAKISKDLGILTVGIVTIPFSNEGKPKRDKADKGIQSLKENVDALIVISNNKLYEYYPDLGIREAFSKADDILSTAARGVTEIITKTGDMNVDFNDVKRVMNSSGVAIIGIGNGSGSKRAEDAILSAINSPLLEDADILGAKGVVLNIAYGDDFKMKELDLIIKTVQEQTQTDCEVIWGVCKDDSLGEDIAITLIATGFESGEGKQEKRRIVQQQQNKIVHTLDNISTNRQQINTSTDTKKDENKSVNNVEYKSNIEAKEIELEIQDLSKEIDDTFEIKIVDKPRFSIDNHNISNNANSQFNLFSIEDVEKNKLADDQHLERDLIKKRVSLEMQKNEINLNEIEKEPAYKRYGINLDDDIPADKSNISNYVFQYNAEENKTEIKPNAMKDIGLD
ncbi:MAG: cell division protein FtsZ [Sphingobacteriales bacterium]|jgi:cell division protein FtsZ|nr:MAG: cell division protein FtsZ [Sphingobacteriales bacterium]